MQRCHSLGQNAERRLRSCKFCKLRPRRQVKGLLQTPTSPLYMAALAKKTAPTDKDLPKKPAAPKKDPKPKKNKKSKSKKGQKKKKKDDDDDGNATTESRGDGESSSDSHSLAN